MKKIIIGLVILMLLSLGAWAAMKRSEVPQSNVGGVTLKTYQDPEGLFGFQYPDVFSVSGREEASSTMVVARVKVPRGYMPGTNFSEAELTVTWSNASTTVQKCTGKATTTEAAAGNLYETTTNKKILDGDCYTFEYIIHSTNLGNYDPSQGIQAFDKEKIQGELDAVIENFRLLVSSN